MRTNNFGNIEPIKSQHVDLADSTFSQLTKSNKSDGHVADKIFYQPASDYPLPEQRLARAVLEDAIFLIREMKYKEHGGLKKDGLKWEKEGQAALEWINHPEWNGPFSFKNCCEYLGVDPGYVRRNLR